MGLPGLTPIGLMFKIKVANMAEAQSFREELLRDLESHQSQIRDLEMTISHYKVRVQQLVEESASSLDAAVRFRSAGAATVLQDVISDLERRLDGLKSTNRNLVLRLDL